MKQDLSANSGPSEQQTQPVKPATSVKNLYEPYITPPILYGAIRWLLLFVFHITSRLRLRGFSNVPKEGPFIIASNHLSWTDIPLIPLHMRRKVVYMAKEEYFSSKLAWLVRFLSGSVPRGYEAGGWQIANRHHATIIERLGARDAEGAGRAMRDHIRQSGEHALGVLAESGIWKA